MNHSPIQRRLPLPPLLIIIIFTIVLPRLRTNVERTPPVRFIEDDDADFLEVVDPVASANVEDGGGVRVVLCEVEENGEFL